MNHRSHPPRCFTWSRVIIAASIAVLTTVLSPAQIPEQPTNSTPTARSPSAASRLRSLVPVSRPQAQSTDETQLLAQAPRPGAPNSGSTVRPPIPNLGARPPGGPGARPPGLRPPGGPTSSQATTPAPAPAQPANPAAAGSTAAKPAGAAGSATTPSGSSPATGKDEVDLQFPNTPLPEILLLYEQLTGKKIIRDQNVEGATVTIETTGKMPKADAIEFIEKSLLLNGYAFSESGDKMLKVVAFDAKKPPSEGGVRTYLKEDELPSTDVVVNFVLPLTYLEPDDAAKIISELVPPHSYGKLSPVPNSRALVITENSATVRQIVQIAKSLDVEPSRTIQKSFQLTRENAEDVKKALDEILDTDKKQTGGGSSGGYSGTSSTPRPTATPSAQPGAPIPVQGGAPAGATASRSAVVSSGNGGASSSTIAPKIIAVPRTNRLLVIARPVDMTHIESLVNELDAAAELRSFITRQLKYLSATGTLAILEQAISRGNEQAGKTSGGGASSPAGAATSSGTPTNQSTTGFGSTFGRTGSYGGMGSTLGGAGGGFGGTGGYGVGASLGAAGANLQELRKDEGAKALVVGKTLLIADSVQNEIFASGPPEHLRVLNEILDELDQRPKQILISVVIGEMTLADGVEFGLDWLLRPTEFRYSKYTGAAAGAIRNTGSTILDPSGIESIEDLADIGKGLTLYGTISDNVNVIVNALKSNTAFKVISRPTIFTLNNKPASISSGSSIPIPVQTYSGYATGVENTTGITSNIQYQPVELSLNVVPLINSDDELTMQIFQQNNETAGTTTINGNPYPNISSQAVSTMVMVKNNSTILLGGLIRENIEKERGGIPVIGSIPVLKYLFGSTKDRKTRRELLVFIQPRIIAGDGDFPPNTEDNAGQSPFAEETRAFLQQEQAAPPPPVKQTRIGKLIDKLLH